MTALLTKGFKPDSVKLKNAPWGLGNMRFLTHSHETWDVSAEVLAKGHRGSKMPCPPGWVDTYWIIHSTISIQILPFVPKAILTSCPKVFETFHLDSHGDSKERTDLHQMAHYKYGYCTGTDACGRHCESPADPVSLHLSP